MSIKIVIADDHPLIAKGIKDSLEADTNIKVVAMVSDGKAAIDYIENNTIDILLLDIDMPIMNGIDCAAILLQNNTDIKIVILSMHHDAYTIKKVMDMGVNGYLLKTISSEELLYAMKKIYHGDSYFNADVTKALLNNDISPPKKTGTHSPLVDELTKREKEVIKYVCLGLNNHEIGEKLFISHKTVETHRTNIMRKLGVNNAISLVRFALQNDLS